MQMPLAGIDQASMASWGLVALAVAIGMAKLGAECAVRIRMPAVVGELLAGVMLSMAAKALAVSWLDPDAPALTLTSDLGAVFLLFTVGLETDLREMRAVGMAAVFVAIIGVVAPIALGAGAVYALSASTPLGTVLFLSAALGATSIGITAAVLQEAHALERREARIVLGAAVVDDVLGLLVLAAVSAFAQASGGTGQIAWGHLASVMSRAVGFLAFGFGVSWLLAGRVFHIASKMIASGVLTALSAAFCLLFAGLAGVAKLASIVGAFVAGLVLDGVKVQRHFPTDSESLKDIFRPVVALFSPIFFVRMGMLVDLRAALHTRTLLLAGALLVAGVLGKLAAGFAARGPQTDRVLVGVGMIPRGEVGLIFAQVGQNMKAQGQPVLSRADLSALVLMVIATTVIGPVLLRQKLKPSIV